MTTFVFILILSFLVIIHELGHFFLAKKNNVKVHEFGFGYPPKFLRLFTWKKTDFTLNLIPFGGFVRLEGEEYDENASEKEKKNQTAFYNKSAKARLAIAAAGPLVNIIYALFIFSIVFSVMGVPTDLQNRPRIGEISPESPAAVAELKPDYEIVGFRLYDEEIKINKIEEVINFIKLNQGQTVEVSLVGPCQQLTCAEKIITKEIYLRTEAEIPAGQGSMGVAFSDFYFAKGPWYLRPFQGMIYGFQEAYQMVVMILMSLWILISDIIAGNGVPDGIAGPIGIVDQASNAGLFEQGWLTILGFSGMLSLNLGIMNLLPIPALDGGRIFFIFLEKFLGKEKVRRFEGTAHLTGFIILLGLIILISIRDVFRIFQ
ncbi:MAG: hypothetical protein COU63_03095 [Candidatus Pacebacteria bacterium CG10_big_fil_rev_8_21_14_0_10_36_11]|nr:hypothetical protein [Candidatus Pacearchaeota archaeon]OIP74413.1 MAG: hypothetical protein AUK08_01345 [Candidatus Pacebacteria bacterium CG2_30_36_39]PIR64975.1 MAG: hypothetical protein COU63_03095 [Candidatus Pacebacteria bacterium CG10_big_fil_rev_8_21_14_0_10_36_11]PJC42510.1 MAG: hypothetical protein CO040_04130 [Candidatus Pacebacteria bacterium CG_4_9_14_0_2_um_filter_36_8]